MSQISLSEKLKAIVIKGGGSTNTKTTLRQEASSQ